MTRELQLLASDVVARNLRNGTQTQDRRPIQRQPDWGTAYQLCATTEEGWQTVGDSGLWSCESDPGKDVRRSPWMKGDLLYVREPTRVIDIIGRESAFAQLTVRYLADGYEMRVPWPDRIKTPTVGHCLANGCYKEAARTWLRVVDVRPERLQDITEDDARAEGIRAVPFRPDDGYPVCVGYMDGVDDGKSPLTPTAREAFKRLWNDLYQDRHLRWMSNQRGDSGPWVWRTVVELDRERSGLAAKAVAHG